MKDTLDKLQAHFLDTKSSNKTRTINNCSTPIKP